MVDDEIGPHASGVGAAAVETDQQVDIGTFYNVFIRPGRGTANMTAEIDSPPARTNLARLLDKIERNQHSPGASV